ncbi:MAG: ABC transporter permease, partial [Clostridia bacterium]|nr:ABC transporter permease [Clostridia bacterium]
MFRRKVIRELKENKLGYAACITVIAIGLMIYASFAVVSENLTASQVNFYRDQNFADGYADIMEMPAREVDRLKKIDGIRDLQGRTMEEVRVLFPGKTENVYLKLVSFDPRLNNPINAFMLTAGSLPDAQDSKKDIILDNKFFEANHLRLNDELEVVIKGKKVKFTVAGAARNPEFIYALRTAGDVFPDPEKYGVAYLPYETMQSLLGKKNTVNSIVFTLEPGTDFDDVKPVLERELKPYGILSLYPRKDQPSHLMLNQELDGIKATSRSMPAVFLTIAAVVLYIMMRRTVEQQRGQIGVLKALGYKDSEIMLHYLSYSVIIGLLGGALGGAAGIALSFPLTSAYEMFFNMPGLESRISLRYLLESLLISLIFSAAAGYSGCKGILALQPSQAMRPPTPSPGKQIPLERLGSFWNMLTVQGKMAFRNLYRNPKRSVIVFIGITFAFSLAGMTWATKQLSEKMLFEQFEKVETYDTKIIFTDPRKRDKALWELNRFPGVKKAEP